MGFEELKKHNKSAHSTGVVGNQQNKESAWSGVSFSQKTIEYRKSASGVFVLITAGPVIKLCAGGGGIQAPPDRNKKDECFAAPNKNRVIIAQVQAPPRIDIKNIGVSMHPQSVKPLGSLNAEGKTPFGSDR